MTEQADGHQQQFADLLSQLTDSVARGDSIDFDAVCRDHPGYAAELRQLWGAVLLTDTAGAVRDERPRMGPMGNPDEAANWRSLTLPVTMGDYELVEELGRGGMGVVFRGRQLSLDREVAVKMILRGRLASPSDMQRFRVEASATAKLEHPNIVPVYEVGEIDGRPFFSMQLIEGETLADRAANRPLSQRDAAEYIAKISRAIGFAHRNGVLHRDLKPSNILITANGVPLVTDFGLAKQTDAPNELADLAIELTRSGMLVGTPAYMSPEQASGRHAAIGPATDIYSLGCILYFALTGRAPFAAASPMDLIMLVIEQDPPPPRSLRNDLDRDLEMIVVRCLQKPIDLRYESADALADDLEAYLADEPIAARSGRFGQVIARVFRETHHAQVLENWGRLWMWHALVLLIASLLTWQLDYHGVTSRWMYATLWTIGLGAWAGVFWKMRQRMGPVTFIERQVAHVWGASLIATGMLFPMEWWLEMKVLSLSPLVGLIGAMIFVIKAGMLSGAFYIQAAALMLTSVAMAVIPSAAHLIFGIVVAGCFFIPGYKYERQRSSSV